MDNTPQTLRTITTLVVIAHFVKMYLYILLTGFVDYCTVYSQFPDVSIKVVYIMLRGWSFMFDKKSDVIFLHPFNENFA